MAAPQKNLSPVEGNTFVDAVTCVNASTQPINVSTYTFYSELRTSPGGSLIAEGSIDMTNAASGVVTVTIPGTSMLSRNSSQTSAWPNNATAWLDLSYLDTSGNKVTLCIWVLQLQARITVF